MYTKDWSILGDLFFLISMVIFFLLFIYLFIFFWEGGGQKIESLWSMQILWILFGGSSQNWNSLGFIPMQLQVFLSSKYRTGIYFVGCLLIVVSFWLVILCVCV